MVCEIPFLVFLHLCFLVDVSHQKAIILKSIWIVKSKNSASVSCEAVLPCAQKRADKPN